ncbi:A24 family peptidase [Shewanella sp. JM162201]|uniref:Prepilin leader peptidase/N-methyltransferase n=1 Tax=Shewanella jiangmenensis TaxID=2837387 RepID=A0ABS5V0K4_9GAMM|nr:A24 family peptidase [Shewanella jiangmenensis]MBT1443999.1 A24 family peptidase [Shewanella jiangmenensis]
MTEFLTLMSQYSWLFVLLSFIFAATIGSFLNVVIHRLPVMMKREWQAECNAFIEEYRPDVFKQIGAKALEAPIDNYPPRYNLIVPTSACPKCGASIKPWHNIPVLGWVMLGGKCAACKNPISARYPIIEALTGAMVATLAWHFGPTAQFAAAALLSFGLIAMSGIDLDEMLLPDSLTLPLLWLGLILNFNGIFTNLNDALIGAIAGYLSLWSVYWLFKLTTGKEGMGYGDFKLMALLGAWFGWQMLPLIILLSSLVGAIVGISMMIFKRHQREKPIPFGPYIAAAGWIALIWGEDIVSWYLGTL